MANQEPISLCEFMSRFPNEDECRKYLFHIRWPNGYLCPKCGNISYYYLSGYHLYQCASCDYQASITAGTILHKTHTSLYKWFLAIYLVSTDKRGCSALTIQRHIKVNYKTAWLMLHKIRHAMGQRDTDYLLEGIVQVDETYLGGPNGKQGRGTRKTPAFVAVSTVISNDGEVIPMFGKIKVVERIDSKTAHEFLNGYVESGAKIITDFLAIYNSLPKGFEQERVKADTAEGQKALEWLHIFVSNAKAFILGTYHGLATRHLQAYMDEYCYRFNRRQWVNELFPRLLNACVNAQTITMAEVTG